MKAQSVKSTPSRRQLDVFDGFLTPDCDEHAKLREENRKRVLKFAENDRQNERLRALASLNTTDG